VCRLIQWIICHSSGVLATPGLYIHPHALAGCQCHAVVLISNNLCGIANTLLSQAEMEAAQKSREVCCDTQLGERLADAVPPGLTTMVSVGLGNRLCQHATAVRRLTPTNQ
jgi:hypothetical protein